MKSVLILLLVSVFTIGMANDKHIPEKSAKTNVISGVVTDSNTGELLIGVAVTLDETTVYTDFEGKFEFNNVTSNEATVKLDLVSYNTKKATLKSLKNKGTLNIVKLESIE